jgi:hypothetical protein
MVMAKKGKGYKNNNVIYFPFYYPSVLNSHNTCPRTSMSNLSIAASERLTAIDRLTCWYVGKGLQAPVFKPSHAHNPHIIIYKPFRITRKTEERQSGTLAPGVVASDSTTKVFTVRHAIAAQQNQ